MPTRNLAALTMVALLLSPTLAEAETTIEYVFATENAMTGRPPVLGRGQVTSTIDGPRFRNVSRNAIELSEDDGKTTHFGALNTTPQTPLMRQPDDVTAPIVGSIEDEKLSIGASMPGPSMFGMPTRTYVVDYDYTIVARVAYVFRRSSPTHAHFTFTVADCGVSSAALRVAFSRGYGYALSQRGDAFSGVPLVVDGTIESPYDKAHVRIEAESFVR